MESIGLIPHLTFNPRAFMGRLKSLINTAYSWEDGCWMGISLAEMIIYELHVGAFTSEGTFKAIILEAPRPEGYWDQCRRDHAHCSVSRGEKLGI